MLAPWRYESTGACETALIEALGDALRDHGFGGGGVNCLDLISERGAEPGEAGTIGPLHGFPQLRADQRFSKTVGAP